ncbi:MAG: hypothetical protein JKP95_03110 [Oceanicaulis sp.]|nr:hypothetical protein [Oceanicaulis sp.]
MRLVAVIDDDPVEMTILSGLAEHVPGSFQFDHYNSVNAFCEDPKASKYDLVFLDRRVPPIAIMEKACRCWTNADLTAPS